MFKLQTPITVRTASIFLIGEAVVGYVLFLASAFGMTLAGKLLFLVWIVPTPVLLGLGVARLWRWAWISALMLQAYELLNGAWWFWTGRFSPPVPPVFYIRQIAALIAAVLVIGLLLAPSARQAFSAGKPQS
jgi:hypothetical protein